MAEKPVGQHAYEAAQSCRLGKNSLNLTMNAPFWELPPSERALWVAVWNAVSFAVVSTLTGIADELTKGVDES